MNKGQSHARGFTALLLAALLVILSALASCQNTGGTSSYNQKYSEGFGDGNYYKSKNISLEPSNLPEDYRILFCDVAMLEGRLFAMLLATNVPINGVLDNERSEGYYDSKMYLLGFDATGERVVEKEIETSKTALSINYDFNANSAGLSLLVYQYSDFVSEEASPNPSFELISLDIEGNPIRPATALPFSTYCLPPDSANKESVISAPTQFFIDEEKNLYFCSSNDVIVWDKNGQKLIQLSSEYDKYSNLFYYDGSVCQALVDQKSQGLTYDLYRLDLKQKDFTKWDSVKDIFHTSLFTLADKALYYANNTGLQKSLLETDHKESLFYWEQTNYIKPDESFIKPIVFSDNSVFLFSDDTGNYSLALLNKQSTNPKDDIEIITLGGFNISFDTKLQKSVYNFNQSQSDYQIKIEDYSIAAVEAGGGDYEASLKQLQVRLIEGKGPDIIIGNDSWMQQLTRHGLLLDLSSYLEKNPNFKTSDFLELAFLYGRRGNQQFYLLPALKINAMVGLSSLVGTDNTWTIKEAQKIAEDLPDNCKLLPSGNQVYLFSKLITDNLSSFVDSNSGKLSIASPLLDDAITFVNNPKVSDSTQEDTKEVLWEKIKNGELVFEDWVEIGGPYSYLQTSLFFGGSISLRNVPRLSEPQGLSIQNNNFIGVSSRTNKQDISLSFLNFLFSAENQKIWSQADHGIPVHLEAFELQITDAMQETGIIEINGNYLQDLNGKVLSEEQAKAYRKLISDISVVNNLDGDESVLSIVMEEAQTYFSGSKSKEEFTQILENRLQSYLNERSK